jgi:hypothetical protein
MLPAASVLGLGRNSQPSAARSLMGDWLRRDITPARVGHGPWAMVLNESPQAVRPATHDRRPATPHPLRIKMSKARCGMRGMKAMCDGCAPASHGAKYTFHSCVNGSHQLPLASCSLTRGAAKEAASGLELHPL